MPIDNTYFWHMNSLYAEYKIVEHFVYLHEEGLDNSCGLRGVHALGRFSFIPPHDSDGVLWFHVGHLYVHLSILPSVICPSIRIFFQMITWVNVNGFSPNLVHICALILWRPGMGLLMDKFHQFLHLCPLDDTGRVFSFRVFIFIRETTLWHQTPSEKGSTLKGKNLSPRGSKH